MAAKRFPNERIVTSVEPEFTIFKREVKQVVKDAEVWVETDRFVVEVAKVADSLEDGESLASMKSYGIRAFLLDRTSQFREFGTLACMKQIEEAYNTTLAVGIYKAKRAASAGSIDSYLAEALAELKGVPVGKIAEGLKALTADQRKEIAANATVAAKVAELKASAADAESVDFREFF
jgi:hypothetical protein